MELPTDIKEIVCKRFDGLVVTYKNLIRDKQPTVECEMFILLLALATEKHNLVIDEIVTDKETAYIIKQVRVKYNCSLYE